MDVSQTAVLDWNTAMISLPLDGYGMTPYEAQVVDAAGSIDYAMCVLDSSTPPTDVIQEAARYLSTMPIVNHWLYGWWDAPYIAQYGIAGVWDDPLSWIQSTPEKAAKCQEGLFDEGLTPLVNGNAMDPQSSTIMIASVDSYDQTMHDSAFISLQSQWRDCVAAAGYAIESGYNTSAAYIDPSWSDEQVLRASLTNAKCADDMSYTQQVADINATYQMQYVNTHEAELVATRQVAENRVAKAIKILQDAGVM